MDREAEIQRVYEQLNALFRRSRELSNQLHPQLSIGGYTILVTIAGVPGIRASDLVERFGMDKSVVSRYLERLTAEGYLRRSGGRPGRRGDPLSLTAAGRRVLTAEQDGIRAAVARWLEDFADRDLAAFGDLLARFNASVDDCVARQEPPLRSAPNL